MGKFWDLKKEKGIQQCQIVFAYEISQKKPVGQFWSKATCKIAFSDLVGQTPAQAEARLPMSTLSCVGTGSFLLMKTVSGQQFQKLL